MAAGERISGKCLCGAIGFEAEADAGEMGACHCGQCRRWTGGVFLYVSVAPETLKLTGAEHLGVYKSSSFGERCFCTICGSTLIWRKQDGTAADVSAQAMDDPARFPFAVQVHLADKPDNYAFANDTARYPAGTPDETGGAA